MKKMADEVRKDVSKAYGTMVTTAGSCGCCGKKQKDQKGALAHLAKYSREELAALPPDAVVSSFGCGNPVAMAGLEPSDMVVDLGSGAGIDLFLAAKKVGPTGHVIGVDMTDEMIAKANANIRAGRFANVEVRKGIIENMPVESASADWIISNCVINLSPEKPKVFREIARVLKPGGQMLVSDIVAEDLPEKLLAIAAAYSSCISGAISEKAYLSGLEAAGLVDVAVRERLVYTARQLEEVFSASILADTNLRDMIPALEGKVWSAKVYGRKPE